MKGASTDAHQVSGSTTNSMPASVTQAHLNKSLASGGVTVSKMAASSAVSGTINVEDNEDGANGLMLATQSTLDKNIVEGAESSSLTKAGRA